MASFHHKLVHGCVIFDFKRVTSESSAFWKFCATQKPEMLCGIKGHVRYHWPNAVNLLTCCSTLSSSSVVVASTRCWLRETDIFFDPPASMLPSAVPSSVQLQARSQVTNSVEVGLGLAFGLRIGPSSWARAVRPQTAMHTATSTTLYVRTERLSRTADLASEELPCTLQGVQKFSDAWLTLGEHLLPA